MSYKLFVELDDIIELVEMNNKIPCKDNITKAYKYAKAKHAGVLRVSGEDYIYHPARVARLVADWGFPSEVVIAALLHDVVEDTHTPLSEITKEFGLGVSNLVNSVTKIDRDLKEFEGLTKEELRNLSDAKLQEYITDKALYIKIADRLDNLYTIRVFDEPTQLKTARHTREILIPMILQVKAYKLLDELEELCFAIEHKTEHSQIVDYFEEYKAANVRSCNSTILLLENAFLHSKSVSVGAYRAGSFPAELLPYRRFISGFSSQPRSCISIFRQIVNESKNIKNDFSRLLNKKYLAFYDLTLTFDNVINKAEEGLTMHDIFYKYFESYFMNYNICILDYKSTTKNDCNYFLLCDDFGNMYRLFIRTDSSYLHYRLGTIIDNDTSLSFEDVNEVDPRDTYKPKITVFKRNGDKCLIDAGATALDFAFLVHTELGLHFDYAIINHGRHPTGPHYVLNEGDEIEIFTNPKISPKIHWFRYTKTSRAVKKLVEYLA